MKVQNLLQFLRTLEEPLRSAGGPKIADELRSVCERMQPFGELSLVQFTEFLGLADHYVKCGELPLLSKGAAAKTKGVDTEKVRLAAQAVTNLYERAINTDVDYALIKRELDGLNKQLTKDEALALATEVNIAKPVKSKKAAFDAIQARIVDRKQSFERTRF